MSASPAITLEDVSRAWASRDPRLAELMVALAGQTPERRAVRDDAVTWERVLVKHTSRDFRRLDPEVRRQQRLADYQALEAADAEVPLPDGLRLHEVLLELWADRSPWARLQLVRAIAEMPLVWGPWRALKRIFKEAEAAGDWEIYGALAARLDVEYTRYWLHGHVRRPTVRYLVRRAWRSLRQLGVRLPSAYPDAAAEILRHYPATASLDRTWVANHILVHEQRAYSRSRFVRSPLGRNPPDLAHRAFGEAWRRSPRPLFGLLERAQHDVIRGWVARSLQTDFRTQLREVEPGWVVRLLRVRSVPVDEFVVWLLEMVPRFEPSAFPALGLHEALLGLLDSPSSTAAGWAVDYARIHARDLALGHLIRLANAEHETVRTLARDLLADRDPRTEVGLAAWGRLLGTSHGHALAARAIQEHFGPAEIDLPWLHERLLAGRPPVVELDEQLLLRLHPDVPAALWAGVLDDPRVDRFAVDVVARNLARADVASLAPDVLRRGLLNPLSQRLVRGWVREGRVPARVLGVDFVKALAYAPTFLEDPWMADLRASDRDWAHDLQFDERLSAWALEQLGDPRAFAGREIGVDWLIDMVRRSEERYHDFAVATLTRSFAPADFAPADRRAPEAGAEVLWDFAVGDGPADEPVRRFALHYLRMHHPPLYLRAEEQPLPEGLALPAGFVSLARARRLVGDERAPVRALGLAWMEVDLAAWHPSALALIELAELPYDDVHAFVALALTADDKREHAGYRLDPERLTVAGVYRFCESLDARTRALGLKLIEAHPRLAVPDELFRLTESPDRQVRAFVVRQLWATYRHRATSPVAAPEAPEHWPAPAEDLRQFLRRTLFAIPPGRLPKGGSTEGLPPLPARRAKLGLIEVCRDLALEDEAFATRVTPLFREFLRSRGQAESEACLVALARIRHRWPALDVFTPASASRSP